MSPVPPVIKLHGVAEAYFYLMVQSCRVCAKGPLKPAGGIVRLAGAAFDRNGTVAAGWKLAATCPSCDAGEDFLFAIDPEPTREQAGSEIINPTPKSSEAIDLLQWLTLFQTVLAASAHESDKKAARRLAWEAALCLDEALKFYPPRGELPPESAFFSDESRRRFRDHPDSFSREKWRQRRLMLPDAAAHTRGPGATREKAWWKFWR